MEKKIFEGIRVVDLSTYIAGPLLGKTLADYGAEVIRIESKAKIGDYRVQGPFKDNIPNLDTSSSFLPFESSKLSISLNTTKPQAVEVIKKLVTKSDIVIENFRAQYINRIGLNYEVIKKIKPDIIMLSSCMMGQTGPRALARGWGAPLSALTGFFNITGWPDREPPELGAYTDFIAPYFSLLALVAALDYRRRTGKGQYIDVSQFECGVHFLAPLVMQYATNRKIAGPMGNRSLTSAPHGAYRCRGNDRWCTLAVSMPEEWQNFVKTIGAPAWTKERRFTTFEGRKENEDELDKLVELWTITQSDEEVMAKMQGNLVPAGIVQTVADIMHRDPQLKYRGFFSEPDHPLVGKYHAARNAFILSKAPAEVRRVPLLGEHNEYIFKEVIGLSDGEIANLVSEGVVE